MRNHPHPGFITTELNRQLLSTPYGIQTNWHVITGAPSCGKTTLLHLLAGKGFTTVPESARLYMEGEIASGRAIAEIRANAAALQRVFLDMQKKSEDELPASGVIFLDGAIPGSLAWFRVFGLDPNEALPECFHRRYASVFVLDRLPHQLNGFRFEDDAYSGFLDEWIARDYSALGYLVVRVPVLAPEERLAFVLERLTVQGKSQRESNGQS